MVTNTKASGLPRLFKARNDERVSLRTVCHYERSEAIQGFDLESAVPMDCRVDAPLAMTDLEIAGLLKAHYTSNYLTSAVSSTGIIRCVTC